MRAYCAKKSQSSYDGGGGGGTPFNVCLARSHPKTSPGERECTTMTTTRNLLNFQRLLRLAIPPEIA